MIEEWRDIEGYEGLYQVSNTGRVKSLSHKIKANISGGVRYTEEHFKILHKGWHGYIWVALCKEAKSKTFSVHRLVAKAFVPNINDYPAINHIDGNKENNNASNLEWCTNAQNSRHAIEHGLINSAKKVRCVETGKIYRCAKDAAEDFGLDARNIRSACAGTIKTSGGHRWEWA